MARTATIGPRTAAHEPRHAGPSSSFLLVILSAQLMVVLDTTIVNVALSHIQAGLGFSASGLSWVLNAYLLTFGGLLLLGARSGDLIGRRRVFLTGIGLFTVSSMLGGMAATPWELLAARALQGGGAAMAAPSALALLTTVFAEGAQRVRAIGLFTTVSAAGGAVGLVLGGLLTELVSWRWVMFVNVPIGLSVLLVGHAVIAETPRRRGRFDIAGAVTSTLGMTAIVLGLVEAASDGWGAGITVGSLSAGIALLAAFHHVERRAEEPILPLRLFADTTRTAANVARGLVYASMFGVFFFLGQFVQDAQGFSPMLAGLAFLPIPISVFASSQLASRVLIARVPAKAVMLGGMSAMIASLVLLTGLSPTTPYAQVLASLVLMGVGAGTSLVTLTAASLAGVPSGDAGAASGLVNVVQQVGAVLGLAVLVTVSSAVAPRTGPAHTLLDAHAIDVIFAVAAGFAVAALVLVAAVVKTRPATEPVPLGAEESLMEEYELSVDAA